MRRGKFLLSITERETTFPSPSLLHQPFPLLFLTLRALFPLESHLLVSPHAVVRNFCQILFPSVEKTSHITHSNVSDKKMNSTTRDNVFANKERLHQLTQEHSRDSSGEKEEQYVGKERARQEARALEEKRYLKQHNKTVSRVLNQAAKATDPTRLSSEDEEEEEESEDDSDFNDQQEQRQRQTEGESDRRLNARENEGIRKEREIDVTSNANRGKWLVLG